MGQSLELIASRVHRGVLLQVLSVVKGEFGKDKKRLCAETAQWIRSKIQCIP